MIRTAREKTIDILVVEDSATQAKYLAQMLREAGGYSVRIAVDGRDGLRAAREVSPTLIVSDIAMPQMDGFEMCREIKKDPALRDTPVILLTSLTSLHDVIRGLDCGADNFIRKPFDGNYLLGRIRVILANRGARGAEQVQFGMQVKLGGQTHFITAERQQIFDLLISTYEEAIQMAEQLKAQQERIAHNYQSLEGLYRIAEALNPALTEQAVGELALERLVDFPGVLGACIKLFGADGKLRLVAARDFALDSRASDSCATCHCERQLQSGELTASQLVLTCEQLDQPHACIPLATGAGTRGVLCLMTTESKLADDKWQVLETVGNQIAVAVERARLYGSMEAQVKERTDAWQSERKLLSAVVNTSGALVCMVDAGGSIRLFNPACEQATGWPALEAIGRPCWDVFEKTSGSSGLRQFFEQPPESTGPTQVSGEWRARDGSVREIVWSTTWLRKSNGQVEYFLGTGVDVTELRGAEEQVRYLSSFDTLTGLPNRILMRERVTQMQEKASGDGELLGYLMLKPERLRLIGESLGIEAEEAMVRQVAERLSRWEYGTASVARIGERTFAIAVLRKSPEELSALARELLVELSLPFLHEGQELHLEPAIGIAVYPNDGEDYDTLVQGSEAAVRRAIGGTEERYEFYRPELNQGAQERFRMESALRRAIERGEFVLHYQPQASLASGKIIGVEALVRWQHPDLGLIAPGCFIGLAEETGLILPIGEFVLRRACQQSIEWQRAGLPAVPVSVNLSARQFSEHIVLTVERILAETGLAPHLLELELTESASMEDPKKTFEILRQLKDMGVQLAIDDFGTGYSNLSYLKRFPVDKLKLDQSFVREIATDPHDLSIARAVIAMGHGLGLTVIAEGVESADQLALLAENGCDEIQGYFFSRPVAVDVCASLLGEGRVLELDSLLRSRSRP